MLHLFQFIYVFHILVLNKWPIFVKKSYIWWFHDKTVDKIWLWISYAYCSINWFGPFFPAARLERMSQCVTNFFEVAFEIVQIIYFDGVLPKKNLPPQPFKRLKSQKALYITVLNYDFKKSLTTVFDSICNYLQGGIVIKTCIYCTRDLANIFWAKLMNAWHCVVL